MENNENQASRENLSQEQLMQKRLKDKDSFISKLQLENKELRAAQNKNNNHWTDNISEREREELTKLADENPRLYAEAIAKKQIEFEKALDDKNRKEIEIENAKIKRQEFIDAQQYYIQSGIDLNKIPIAEYEKFMASEISIDDIIGKMTKVKENIDLPTNISNVSGSTEKLDTKQKNTSDEYDFFYPH